jgi:hypothetical protein
MGNRGAESDESERDVLNCTSTGQVLTSLGGRTAVQLNAERLKKLVPANPLGQTPREARQFRESARQRLLQLLALPGENRALESRTLSSHTRTGVHVDEIVLHSDPSIRVTGWFLKPEKAAGPFPTIFHASERGKYDAVEETGEIVQ